MKSEAQVQPKFPNGCKQILIDETVNKTITILFLQALMIISFCTIHHCTFLTMDIEITGRLCNIIAIFLEFIQYFHLERHCITCSFLSHIVVASHAVHMERINYQS